MFFFSVPSFSALSAALGTRRSFSPPLSKYQTIGCESSRRSRFLQQIKKAAVQQDEALLSETGVQKKNRSVGTASLWSQGCGLRDLSCSNDVLKVLQWREKRLFVWKEICFSVDLNTQIWSENMPLISGYKTSAEVPRENNTVDSTVVTVLTTIALLLTWPCIIIKRISGLLQVHLQPQRHIDQLGFTVAFHQDVCFSF